MHTMPTMEVMAERAALYKHAVLTECLLCRRAVETVEHGWRCEARELTVRAKRHEVVRWQDDPIYKGRGVARAVREAV